MVGNSQVGAMPLHLSSETTGAIEGLREDPSAGNSTHVTLRPRARRPDDHHIHTVLRSAVGKHRTEQFEDIIETLSCMYSYTLYM